MQQLGLKSVQLSPHQELTYFTPSFPVGSNLRLESYCAISRLWYPWLAARVELETQRGREGGGVDPNQKAQP